MPCVAEISIVLTNKVTDDVRISLVLDYFSMLHASIYWVTIYCNYESKCLNLFLVCTWIIVGYINPMDAWHVCLCSAVLYIFMSRMQIFFDVHVLIVISVGCCMHLEWCQTGLLDMGSRKGPADMATARPIFAAYKLVPEKPVDVISVVLNSKFFPHFMWIRYQWNFCMKQTRLLYTMF